MSWGNLMAEQSVYAQLVIERRPVEQSRYQQNNTRQSYMRNNTNPASNVDHSAYRIVNMPDTIAYVPKHSIFENIILFHTDFADFRFVPINRVVDGLKTNESIPSIVITNQLQPIDPYVGAQPNRVSSIFTESLGAMPTHSDPVFDGLTGGVTAMPGYSLLRTQVSSLVSGNGLNPSSNQDWVNDLYTFGMHSNEYVNLVNSGNSSVGNNNESVYIRLVASLSNIPHDANLSSPALNQVVVLLRQFISKYVSNVQANQRVETENQVRISQEALAQAIQTANDETNTVLAQQQLQQQQLQQQQQADARTATLLNDVL